MYTVYILQSLKDNRTYVGYTNNLNRRIKEHNTGQVESTKNRIPFKILLTENFENGTNAKERESWWKSGAGRRELRKILKKFERGSPAGGPLQQ